MRVIESLMTENPCYKDHEALSPNGLVIQTLWRPQPSAKVLIHNWNRESQKDVCPHLFIDAHTGEVFQTLPFDVKGKHSGSTLNEHTIGIIMCEPLGIKHEKGEAVLVGKQDVVMESLYKTYNSAVELCAELCAKFSIDPLTGIHIYKKRNPEKLWAWFNVPSTLTNFKGDVLFKMAENKTTAAAEVKKPTLRVRVDVPNLRIRTGPGREYEYIGEYTGAGEFLITEVQNGSGSEKGWGKLDSGKGWISLDHATELTNEG